jgi:hypothetical protein
MYHYYNVIQDQAGNSLPGYFVALTDSNGSPADLFTDENGTPIISVSGEENKAKTEDAGNVSFFVADDTYDINVYAPDAQTLIYRIRAVPMVGDLSNALAQAAQAVEDSETAAALSGDKATEAGGYATAADQSAQDVAADRAAVASDKAAVAADKVAVKGLVDQARAATALSGFYADAAKDYVPAEVTSLTVDAAGSGGTDGTFDLAWTGGNFDIDPTGTFTVSGGVVTAVELTSGGLCIAATVTPPTPDFSASSGLTGATLTIGTGAKVASGNSYLVAKTGEDVLTQYYNVGGVATVSDPLVTVIKKITFADDATAITGTAADQSLTPKSGNAAIGAAVAASGYRNRWDDARFRALHDANSTITSNELLLDGNRRVFGSPGTKPAWDMDGSPFGNPALATGTSSQVNLYLPIGEEVFAIGDDVRAKVGIIVPTGSTFSLTLFAYSASDTSLGNSAVSSVVGDGSYVEIDLAKLTIPDNAASLMIRCLRTAGTGQAILCSLQATLGTLARPMEEDAAAGYVSRKADAAQTAANDNKADFEAIFDFSKNLFNIDAHDVSPGHYVNYTSGALAANASYNATGFIPIDDATEYTISYDYMRAFYDEHKVFISGALNGGATFTPPAGAHFGRFTVAVENWSTFQLEEGDTATSFAPYATIKGSFLPESGGGTTGVVLPWADTGRMRQFRSFASRRMQPTPETGLRYVFALIGDSWSTTSDYMALGLANALIDKLGDGGVGWYGLGFTGPTQAGDARKLYYLKSALTDWTSNYHAGSTSPNISDARSSTPGAQMVVANRSIVSHPALSAVKLHFTGTADGVIRWSWDGGSSWSADTDVQGGNGVQQTLSLTGFPTGALSSAGADTIMLTIEVVSGSVILCGLDLQSASDGIVIHKLGASGAKASDWVTSIGASWRAGIAALGLNGAQILLGVNDQAGGVSADTYAAQMIQILNSLQVAAPVADPILIVPPETPAGYAVAMADYATKLRPLAASNKAAFLNLGPAFGDDPADYASTGAFPLFQADNAHPEPRGRPLVWGEIEKTLVSR